MAADGNNGGLENIMRAIARKLAVSGLEVCYPDAHNGRHLEITSAGRDTARWRSRMTGWRAGSTGHASRADL
jgi:hypothetical protein